MLALMNYCNRSLRTVNKQKNILLIKTFYEYNYCHITGVLLLTTISFIKTLKLVLIDNPLLTHQVSTKHTLAKRNYMM